MYAANLYNAVFRILNRVIVDAFLMFGFEAHKDAYEEANLQLGTDVRVVSGDEVFEGEALGVDDAGALRVRCEDGVRVVHAGDVSRVR